MNWREILKSNALSHHFWIGSYSAQPQYIEALTETVKHSLSIKTATPVAAAADLNLNRVLHCSQQPRCSEGVTSDYLCHWEQADYTD